MNDELTDCLPQRFLPEQNQPVDAFLAEASPESFQVGVEIRRLWGQANGVDCSVRKDSPKGFVELGVSIHQNITLANQETFVCCGQIPGYLLHPGFSGVRRATGEAHTTGSQFHREEKVEGDQA